MRHSEASTTTDVYMQPLEPEVRVVVNLIFDELQDRPRSGPDPTRPSGEEPKPGRPSGQNAGEEPSCSEADNLLLRSLGVRWEAEADGAAG